MKRLTAAAVLTLLIGYAAAFYATPLPDVGGQPMWRIDLLGQLLLRPDDLLFSNWFGTPPQFSLADRLPVLLVAGAILLWAWAAGRLALRGLFAFGRRRTDILICQLSAADLSPLPSPLSPLLLTRLETFVFSVGVGLSILSTWVLLLGLFGLLDRTWTFAVPAALTLLAAGWACHRRRRETANSRGLTAPGEPPQRRDALRPVLPGGDSDDVLSATWLWLVVPFVLAILLAAMLPPFDFDVCEYHLQAPKEFYQQGRITFLPHNVYANMAMGTEMLSLLSMVVAGDWWWGRWRARR